MQPSPITLRRPARHVAGVILTSPHSGRCYPPELLNASRLTPISIRHSEDAFVDELFAMAPTLGLPLLAAEFPRAWCDVNREAWELDPDMFIDPLPGYVNTNSPRVAAGLGTLARVVGVGEPIYNRKLYFYEAEQRINQCWRPFHTALAELISESKNRFGSCLVLDCHSMPSSRGAPQPDIIIGDNYGASCLTALSAYIESSLSRLGFSTCRNKPYAGGFITRNYAQPYQGIQTIQIEISRRLYMNEQQITRKPTFGSVNERLGIFLQKLIEFLALPTSEALLLDAAAECP